MEMIRVITTAGVAERSQYMETIVNFGAYARENWVAEKAASLQNCSKVLDVGAGQCPYRKLFGHCDYKTQDFAGYHGSASASEKERWNYGDIDYVCDINAIPVPDKSFDAVLCTEVLEHVPEPMAAVAEFGRILVRGGRLFLTAPLGSGLHQQPFHYYGGYTPYFYQRVLAQSNFEIVEIRPIGGLLKHVGQEIYRVGRMIASKAPQHLSLLTRLILLYWLPRRLARLEKDVFVEEFTVGYLVEARRL
ncbi:MAG: Methylase involved in ubiquinone/menaquinone biosynthesis [Nitrospira sp.]